MSARGRSKPAQRHAEPVRSRRTASLSRAKSTGRRASRASTTTARASPPPAGFTASREPLRGGAILTAVTSSGTPVVVRPMPGFAKSYAVLAVRFGSLDARLPDGRALPIGLAHFLEHKMFQIPAGDVFDLYAKRGASANAYTTFGYTAYLFSCTSQFDENLTTLLETLHTMHADSPGIEREKGIIGQEIAMYQDDPGWRGHVALLEALYRDHPVRLDITGSKETIAAINRPVLLDTHAAYYHPRNLSLFVAGDVDAAGVLAQAEQRLASTVAGAVNRRLAVPEPEAPAAAERRLSLSVTRPQVTLGIKDVPVGRPGTALLARATDTELMLDVLFGDGGRVEAPLYREGVVDESFGASYQTEHDYAYAAIGAEVDAEGPYRERLVAEIERAIRSPVTAEELERARRRQLGGYLRAFNGPERVASMLLGLHMQDVSLDDAVAALAAATPDSLTFRMRDLFTRPRAWAIVEPRRS